MINEILSSPELSVVFQPVVDLLSARVIGWEVFGRAPSTLRDHPEYVPPAPEDLLDLARREHRLAELEFAWRSIAIDRIAGGRRSTEWLYFLNVDTRIVDDPGYESGVTSRLVMARGLCPARFVLEFTHRGPTDTASLRMLAQHYQRQGFGFAIDDYGTGRSSAGDWWRMSPSFLKLDRQVVAGVGLDPMQQRLVRVITEAAASHGVRVIAEGIESLVDLRALVAAGVTLGQGFLLGRPESHPAPLAYGVRCNVLREVDRVRRTRVEPPCAQIVL